MDLQILSALGGVLILVIAVAVWRRRARRVGQSAAAPRAAPDPSTAEKASADQPLDRSPRPLPGLEVISGTGVEETTPSKKPVPPALRERARRKAVKKFREWAASDDWCVVALACADRSDRGEIEAIAVLDSAAQVRLEHRLRGAASGAPDPAAARWPEVHEEIADVLADFGRVLSYDAGFDARVLKQTCARYGLETPNTRWEGVMQAYAAYRGLWNTATQSFQHHSLDAAARHQGLSATTPSGAEPAQDGKRLIAVLRAVADASDGVAVKDARR